MKKERYSSLAEINITNIVDVMMVLLIVFMLTAPFLQSGVKINLPKAEAKGLEEKEGVIVSIDKEGNIFIDGSEVAWPEFTAKFRKALETTVPRVFLKADRDTRYGIVMKVIGRIKFLGIGDVGLVAEQEDKK